MNETKFAVKWKNGSMVGCSAEMAYRFFERIRADNGGDLDLDDAVHKSKPKDAPLHNDLEWNNAKCGDLYRRDQMRKITQKLEVIRPGMTAATRAYEAVNVEVVSDTPKNAQQHSYVFRRIEDILADPATRADLLGQAVRDAIAFRRRYAALSELSHLIEVIDAEVKKLA